MFSPFKRILLAGTLLLIGLCCFGQVKSGAYRLMLKGLLDHSVPEISVQKLAQQATSVMLLDAREPKEFSVSHLQGAILVGYDHFDGLPVEHLPKDTPLVVYCSVGYRSEKIAEKLLKAGFTNVSNLYGGIFEWVNQGFPVVNDNGPTENVHAYNKKWGVWLRQGKKVY